MNIHIDWQCPACGLTDRTGPLPPNAQRMHPCPKMAGLTTPLVRAGVKAKIERVMREDYVGDEKVQTDDEGRPVMALRTVRDDGYDTVVFAPTATATGDAQRG